MTDAPVHSVGWWWRFGTEILRKAGIEGADRDAQLILASHLKADPGTLRLQMDRELTATEFSEAGQQAYQTDLQSRAAGRPVSKILGTRAFWESTFYVNDDVLDPRPDTELLIEVALQRPYARCLDLGTGSGCIAITLALQNGGASILATDISEKALQVARRNARAIGVESGLEFRRSDWLEAVEGKFDLIVSNPPYIAADEMSELAPDLAFDPREALTDEADGLSAYRVIAAQAPDYLLPGGRLLVEIGWRQGDIVADMFKAAGFDDLRVLKDLAGHDRVVAAVWRG
ncbi:peptide chain release factor N(5)-glutamine methyltransferase [Roseovarius gahaiensis]|uniref:Release factor glutamine methyltransferase n=1 Tax=Roseovarius gahaiensis TaxID=2716691 RepID=A0A967B8Z1_9RHOB|nr:peptide chain release factor N(5)-glutamine methyltransferase [Roseovarius gahaiensis]NHQ73507.1 peptide chain release factor N(5)-glutamine methyltransferase [Roseovarius gahaiensis]